MKVLGIESSGMTASVALATEGVVVAEYSTNFKQTHSQTLLPMLDEMCSRVQWEVGDVDVIAISSGPGSFTGLRIGSATAKGLGLALNKPLVEVPTLEGLGFNAAGTDRLVCAMMDARRGNVYAGVYEYVMEQGASGDSCDTVQYVTKVRMKQELVSVSELVDRLNGFGEKVLLLGDAVMASLGLFNDGLKVDWRVAPVQSLYPRAASVAVLGGIKAAAGGCIGAAQHVPDYLRPSQAERERNSRA